MTLAVITDGLTLSRQNIRVSREEEEVLGKGTDESEREEQRH